MACSHGSISARPPSNNESKKAAIAASTRFCGPEIDGSCSGKCRTNLGHHSGRDHHKDASHDIARPDYRSVKDSSSVSLCRVQNVPVCGRTTGTNAD